MIKSAPWLHTIIITMLQRGIREMEQTDKTEKYEALEMEVIAFENGDIIMTSSDVNLTPL